ncbi:MAG: DUF4169 family protein [Rhizobiaceae bacterium]|nr:DUF4169 family protein [Rhizobiaceae bacterium]
MAELVNLRQFRKRKQREEKQKQSENNRKKHGISTKFKREAAAREALKESRLDGAKRSPKE